MTDITTTSVMNEIENIMDGDYSFVTKHRQYILLQIAIAKNNPERAERKLKIVSLLNAPFIEHGIIERNQEDIINYYRNNPND